MTQIRVSCEVNFTRKSLELHARMKPVNSKCSSVQKHDNSAIYFSSLVGVLSILEEVRHHPERIKQSSECVPLVDRKMQRFVNGTSISGYANM